MPTPDEGKTYIEAMLTEQMGTLKPAILQAIIENKDNLFALKDSFFEEKEIFGALDPAKSVAIGDEIIKSAKQAYVTQ